MESLYNLWKSASFHGKVGVGGGGGSDEGGLEVGKSFILIMRMNNFWQIIFCVWEFVNWVHFEVS